MAKNSNAIVTKNYKGEYIYSTWTDDGETQQLLTEQEVNAHLNKPKFTSVVEEPVEEDDASFLTDAGRVGFSTLEGFAQLGSDVIIRPRKLVKF